MLLEAHDLLWMYLEYFITAIVNEPLVLLWTLFNPFILSLIYLMLIFKIFRSLFFAVGVLISYLALCGIFYFALLSLIMTTQFNNGNFIVGSVVFCLVCAYLCLKQFVNYSAPNHNLVALYDNIKILLFGAFYIFCNIGFILNEVKMMTGLTSSGAFSEMITGFYYIFFAYFISVIIASLIAAIIYLLIKILPFKNAKRIAFLVLGICFIIYLLTRILSL